MSGQRTDREWESPDAPLIRDFVRSAPAFTRDDPAREQSNQKTMNRTLIGFFVALLGLTVSALAGPDRATPEPKLIVIDQAPPDLKDVTSRLWTVVFSPDGKTLAVTAGWDNPREPGELVLWDVAKQQPKLIWRQEAPIRTAAFSGDGKLLAIGDFAGVTRLLDPITGKIVLTFPEHFKVVNSVAFTPDNKTLVTSSLDGTIKLWDAASGEEQHGFSLPGEGIVKVAISSDSRMLAAVTWPGKAHVWDLTRREELHVLQASQGQAGRTQIAEAVAFAPDGKSLVTGSWDTTLRLWETASGKLLRDLAGHNAPVQSAAISPDGKTLASGDAEGQVMLFNCATGERLAVLKAHTDRCFGLAFSPNGKHLATAGWDRVVKIWDLETREPIAILGREKR
jgi:WD40 repeat protein